MAKDDELIKTFQFLETLKKRFTEEKITALDLSYYKINPKHELIQAWLEVNKEYELIGKSIYKNTKKERILQQEKYVHVLQLRFVEKGRLKTQLEKELITDEAEIKTQMQLLQELMGD